MSHEWDYGEQEYRGNMSSKLKQKNPKLYNPSQTIRRCNSRIEIFSDLPTCKKLPAIHLFFPGSSWHHSPRE